MRWPVTCQVVKVAVYARALCNLSPCFRAQSFSVMKMIANKMVVQDKCMYTELDPFLMSPSLTVVELLTKRPMCRSALIFMLS